MSDSKSEYIDLVEKALKNAQEDRELAKEAFLKLKPMFDVNPDDPETFQTVMLMGASAVKLIESQSRSNEQIIKLAQLRQKEKPDKNEDEEEPFDIEKLRDKLTKNKVG